MSKHIKKFETEAKFDEWKASEDFVLPHLSWCATENTIKSEALIAPPLETRLVAKYDVFGTGYATQLQSALTSNIASMEIDGVELQTPVSEYTFDTKGEHVVKYTLIDNTTIGTNAFESCTRLTSITIPDSVITIGDYAFSGCTNFSFAPITIPDSVITIGQNAFRECHFPSLTIGSGVTTIGYSAFSTCTTLSSLTIPDSVTTIERNAFASCVSLSSVTIGSGVTSIGIGVFSNCSSLSSLTIPNSVTSIGNDAFKYCRSLSSITIPDNVTSIGNSAFQECENLSSITYNGTQAQWASVTKGTNWNRNVPATVVHCSDGDVTL